MAGDVERIVSGAICEKDLHKIREAVCIQVEKIYDSCKEKDCIEDQRVLFRCPEKIQALLKWAINVKCRKAEVADVFADVEPVPFKRGFYTVDVKFFIKVTLDFFVPRNGGGFRTITIPGLVLFDKKVILFGSEGNVRIFKSKFVEGGIDKPIRSKLQQSNLPISKVEVAEPIPLNAKIQDLLDKLFEDNNTDRAPSNALDTLDDDDVNYDFDETGLLAENEDESRRHFVFRRVVVTIGLFSIIKLVRFIQLLIPAFDFCVPNKNCIASTDENPCELFDSIEFPVDEFYPPQIFQFPGLAGVEDNDGHGQHGGHGPLGLGGVSGPVIPVGPIGGGGPQGGGHGHR